MDNKERFYKLIGAVSAIADEDAKAEIITMIEAAYLPKEKEKVTRNRSGVVQIDPETGKVIATFETIKAANEALGKKASSSSISDACKKPETRTAYGFKWMYQDAYQA